MMKVPTKPTPLVRPPDRHPHMCYMDRIDSEEEWLLSESHEIMLSSGAMLPCPSSKVRRWVANGYTVPCLRPGDPLQMRARFLIAPDSTATSCVTENTCIFAGMLLVDEYRSGGQNVVLSLFATLDHEKTALVVDLWVPEQLSQPQRESIHRILAMYADPLKYSPLFLPMSALLHLDRRKLVSLACPISFYAYACDSFLE